MIAKDDLLTIFIDMTGISDSGYARDLLAGSNWDLQAAVRTYKLLLCPEPTKTPAPSPNTATATQHAALPSNGFPSASGAGPREPLDSDCKRNRAARHCAGCHCRHMHCDLSRHGAAPGTCKVSPSWAPADVRDNQLNFEREHSAMASASSLQAAANRKLMPDDDLEEDGATGAAAMPVFIKNTNFTFTMPNLSKEDPDFAAVVEKDLVDTNMLSNLEAAGRLNWWSPMCEKLIPRITTADGNCLLHSASLCMWGFVDSELNLRTALHRVMADTKKGDWLYRRWRWHQMQQNKQMALVYSEAEWDREWQDLLNLASPKPKYVASKSTRSEYDSCGANTTNGGSDAMRRRSNSMGSHCRPRREVYYKSLEEFHVFVLAHILRRTIIVVADTVLRSPSGDVLQQLPFGGVYLPLGHPPAQCYKAPLLIAYDSSHFSALLPESEGSSSSVHGPSQHRALPLVPLMDPEGSLLPLHFVVDPGERFDWTGTLDSSTSDMTAEAIVGLLREYLKIEYIEWSGPTGSGTVTPSASELELVKCAKKSDGSGKSTLSKIKGLRMSWTLGRKSKKTPATTVGSALKSKSHSKDSLDEYTSDDRRSSADSPADYLLCAELLVELPPHYSDRVSRYLSDAYREFDSRRRGAPAPVQSGSSDAFSRSGCGGSGCSRTNSNAQSTTAATVCPHHFSDALAKSRDEGVTSPAFVPDVTCPRSPAVVTSKPEAGRAMYSEREPCGGSGRILGAPACVAADAAAAGAAVGLESGRKCRTNDCEMYGTAANDNYCSKCYALAVQKQQQQVYGKASLSPSSSPTTGCAISRDAMPVPRPRLASRQASVDGATAALAATQISEGGSQQRRPLGRQSSLYDNLPPSDGSAFTTQLRGDDENVAAFASRTPRHVSDSLALSSGDGAASLSLTSSSMSPPVPQGRASVGRTGAARSSAAAADGGGVRVIAARPADDGCFDSDAHEGVSSTSHGQCHAGEAGGQPRSRGSAPQLEPPTRSAAAVPTWAPKGSIGGSGNRSHARPPFGGSPPDAARVGSSSRPSPQSSFSTTRPTGNPVSLYYAQLHQQQSVLAGGGELCRVKGCKQPAKHDGKCQKCYQSSVSAVQYGEKLRRSFRPPRRTYGNFQP